METIGEYGASKKKALFESFCEMAESTQLSWVFEYVFNKDSTILLDELLRLESRLFKPKDRL